MSEAKNIIATLNNKIVSDAKSNVPVDTGALKRSIVGKVRYNSDDSFGMTVSELAYGKFVNDGTSKQSPQPYLTNAIEKNLTDGIEDITKSITKGILTPITKLKK